MIKQIWFIRNTTRLFVSLSFSINFVISLYSVLSALALTTNFTNENLLISMLNQYSNLLFFPFVGWCMFILFFGLGWYLKRSRKKFLNHKTLYLNEKIDSLVTVDNCNSNSNSNSNSTNIKEIKLELSNKEEILLYFLSHFITSTNFSTSITFAFFSLDVVSKVKNIQSFGMLPVYICWGATWYYYSFLILQLYNSKKD